MIEFVGVVVSAGVWAVGLLATRRVSGAAIAGAPEAWRVRFAAEYEETLSSPLHSSFCRARRRTPPPFGSFCSRFSTGAT